jgi:hypothetical protein
VLWTVPFKGCRHGVHARRKLPGGCGLYHTIHEIKRKYVSSSLSFRSDLSATIFMAKLPTNSPRQWSATQLVS